jgi:hypothetical protein
MISNAGAAQRTARVIYPKLPDPLTREWSNPGAGFQFERGRH